MLSTRCVNFCMRVRYFGEAMSRAETTNRRSGSEGKCSSTFFSWPKAGSLVAKKKFSSTTGLRSTNASTSTKSTAVTASISQCASSRVSLLGSVSFITSTSRSHTIVSALDAAFRATLRRNLDDFHRALWQRLREGAAVRFGHDPIIQNHDDAAIGFGADQAADALSKFQDRFRQ